MTVSVDLWSSLRADSRRVARRVVPWLALLTASACADGSHTEPDGDAITLVGELERYVVDHADGSHRNAFALKRDDGVRVELAASALEAFRSGDRLALRGHYTSNETALSSRDGLRLGSTRFAVDHATKDAAAVGVVEQALVAPPQVTVRTAVVLLNFRGRNPQSYTAATARRELKEVEDYYNDMSWNSWHMVSEVFGPYEVTTPTSCDLNVLADLAKTTARAQGVDIGSFDHVAVKIGGIDGMDCPCGVAYLGNPPARGAIRNGGTSLYTCGGSNAFAHELGHSLGLDHSSTAPCNGSAYRAGLTGCDVIEYGNAYNTMGNGLGHFNAVQKGMLGWLNGCNIQRVSKDAEFDLRAIQLGVDEQTQALQIATGDNRNGGPLYFYVEYRNPALTTFNAKEGNTVREKGPGLHVTVSRDFRENNGEGRTILIDASNGLRGLPLDGQTTRGDPRMQVGETFRPNDRVTIQFVSRTEQVARVKVSFPNGGTGTNACQSSRVPPGPSTVPEGFGAIVFEDCDYDGSAVNLPEGRYTTAQLRALGVKDNDVSSLVLAVGYDAILYENDNFGGRSVTRTQSLMCFNDINLNDALSSIEIRANGMAPVKDAGVDGDAAVSSDAGGGVDAGDETQSDAGVDAPDGGGQPLADAGGGSGGKLDGGAGAVAGGGTGDGDDDEGNPGSGGGCSVRGDAEQNGSLLLLALGMLLSRRRRTLRRGTAV